MKRFLINLWRQYKDPLYCRKCERWNMRLPWRDGHWACVKCELTNPSESIDHFMGRV
jgi:hypothetical protein